MGIFNTMLGNATSNDVESISEQVKEFLYDGENICYVFSYVRDMILFTTSRMIFVDKQGVTGKKKEFLSIPYKSIIRFSVETSGHFDDDSELKFWVIGMDEPIIKEFSGDKNINEIQKLIAKASCF